MVVHADVSTAALWLLIDYNIGRIFDIIHGYGHELPIINSWDPSSFPKQSDNANWFLYLYILMMALFFAGIVSRAFMSLALMPLSFCTCLLGWILTIRSSDATFSHVNRVLIGIGGHTSLGTTYLKWYGFLFLSIDDINLLADFTSLASLIRRFIVVSKTIKKYQTIDDI